MHALTSIIEDAIFETKNQHKIHGTAIYPINQDGRQVTCFCDMNVNNAELYDYNILEKGGNYLLINCWHSAFHCHPHPHMRKIHPPSNAIYQCKRCEFCLFDSAGYNLHITLPSQTDITQFAELIDKIGEKLNAPICNITYHYADSKKKETFNLNQPLYERRVRPCVKPKKARGIFKKSRDKKAKAKLPKGRL
jgi:hypothetical protein